MATNALADALLGLAIDKQSTPWGIAGKALAEVSPSLINPYGKVGTNLGIGLGSILLSSLLGYKAQQTAADESIAASRLGSALSSMPSAEDRAAKIESLQSEYSPRVINKLTTLSNALEAQKQITAAEVANQKAMAEAKLNVEMGPLGQQAFEREKELWQAKQAAIGNRMANQEDLKNQNRIARDQRLEDSKRNLMFAQSRLNEEVKNNKLPKPVADKVANTIAFGNAVEDLIDKHNLDNMSYSEFKRQISLPLKDNTLLRDMTQLEQPYRKASAGVAVTPTEAKNVQTAFGKTDWSGPEEYVGAIRALKEFYAKEADAAMATHTMKPIDLYKGIQELRIPGNRFNILAPPETSIEIPVSENATNSATTQDPETAFVFSEINKKNIPKERKSALKKQYLEAKAGS